MLSQLINTGDNSRTASRPPLGLQPALGDAAATVIEHTIEIKRNERRANDAVVAMAATSSPSKNPSPTKATANRATGWTPSFNMSHRTGAHPHERRRTLRRQNGNDFPFGVTVLACSAAVPRMPPSTPLSPPTSSPVRVADVKAIIADHKPTVDQRRYAATPNGSRRNELSTWPAPSRPWIETYIDDYGRNWRAIDARGNVAHTNSLLWTDITREAQRRNAISISEDILKEAIKLAFAWLLAARPSTINNLPPKEETGDPSLSGSICPSGCARQRTRPRPRPSPSPLPPPSLAQMDADGDIPPSPLALATRHLFPVHPSRPPCAPAGHLHRRRPAHHRHLPRRRRWFEARRLLAAAGIHYRDRDLVQALNNLADELEQHDRTQPAQPSIPSTPSIPSAPSPNPTTASTALAS